MFSRIVHALCNVAYEMHSSSQPRRNGDYRRAGVTMHAPPSAPTTSGGVTPNGGVPYRSICLAASLRTTSTTHAIPLGAHTVSMVIGLFTCRDKPSTSSPYDQIATILHPFGDPPRKCDCGSA